MDLELLHPPACAAIPSAARMTAWHSASLNTRPRDWAMSRSLPHAHAESAASRADRHGTPKVDTKAAAFWAPVATAASLSGPALSLGEKKALRLATSALRAGWAG